MTLDAECDAHTHRGREFLTGDDDRFAKGLHESCGHVHDFFAVRRVLDENRKLVTAESCGRVRLSKTRHQVRGDDAQQFVPGRVSEAVVNHLEVVQVQEQNGYVFFTSFRTCERLIDAVLEESSVGQTREGVVEGQMVQIVFETLLFGDIAETPHSTDHVAGYVLRFRESLEHTTVDELERVVALRVGPGVQILNTGHEYSRVHELIGHEVDQPAIVSGGDEVGRQSPHLGELAIEARDGSIGTDNEKPVAGRLQGGVEQRRGLAKFANGVSQFHLGGDACRDVVGRDDESADRGVIDEADDGEFERDHLLATAAQ